MIGNEYYKRCPNSTSILYFSRVGFNSKMDQALVDYGFNFPYMLAGSGLSAAARKEEWLLECNQLDEDLGLIAFIFNLK